MNVTTRTRLRTVAGVLAVTVACSTGAYAAGAAITSSAQIKNGVVNTGDIKNGTVKVKDLNKKTLATVAPELEAWHDLNTPGNPSLVGFWVVEPSSYAKPGFRKNAEGEVTLRGGLTQNANVAGDSTLTTLPVGYRPSACTAFPVASFDDVDGGSDPDGAVRICPNGVVTVFGETDDRFLSLDGISFYVD